MGKKQHLVRKSDLMAFGEHLKAIREEKNLSMKELADMCGIEHSQISRMENGIINTSLSQVFAIAEALEMHPRDLFDFDL